ncbi:LacI family DNA-binding transcriptional regulator [Aureimonas leprariae]|uniref:LacI family transcriptional regulator n=1 Tax=Plantimonas leprariae TaxID=2615207 RepID=A0A7V7PMQ6_9HYPH|nr:LacI family DNA-binding transcriptional regulator [Aureimonas leprariae]KAB0678517.1 LacI family transcriptional regulator [Aureimonas leprariae]
MTTIRDVAKAAGVSTATVSAVVNSSAFVSDELRARVVAAIEALEYAPSSAAQSLKRGRSQLIAMVVADLANPFFHRIVCVAEAAVAAWGFSLVVFNSDEKPDAERRIIERVHALGCDGMILVPVGEPSQYRRRRNDAKRMPTLLFGRIVSDDTFDTVTIDNLAAGREVTNYLLDLGHRRIGSITGPLHLTTARERLEGMRQALGARRLSLDPARLRSGEFREDAAYSAALQLLGAPDRPSGLYVANGLMALGVMRALADLGLRCPTDISIVSTDTIPGIGGLRPRLTRTEHPAAEMTNEAVRLLVDRITRNKSAPPRNVIFQPALMVGDSCAPFEAGTPERSGAPLKEAG